MGSAPAGWDMLPLALPDTWIADVADAPVTPPPHRHTHTHINTSGAERENLVYSIIKAWFTFTNNRLGCEAVITTKQMPVYYAAQPKFCWSNEHAQFISCSLSVWSQRQVCSDNLLKPRLKELGQCLSQSKRKRRPEEAKYWSLTWSAGLSFSWVHFISKYKICGSMSGQGSVVISQEGETDVLCTLGQAGLVFSGLALINQKSFVLAIGDWGMPLGTNSKMTLLLLSVHCHRSAKNLWDEGMWSSIGSW